MTGAHLRLIVRDDGTDWMDRGACVGLAGGEDLFFPGRGDIKSVNKAKAVCATCPVIDECLEYALANNEHWGVWGGRSERERKRMRAARLRHG